MLFSWISRYSPDCCYGRHIRELNRPNLLSTARKRLQQHRTSVRARQHTHWRSVATFADTPNKSSRGGRVTRKPLADPEYAWLAAQLHPTKNEPGLRLDDIGTGSRKHLWWQCQGCSKCGRVHEWKAPVYRRAGAGGRIPSGCPSCATKWSMPCFCRSVASDAQLSKEWCREGNKGVLPEAVSLNSSKKLLWKCLRNPSHPAYQAAPTKRSYGGSGCPECAKEFRAMRTRRGSLSEEHPELAEQWDHERNERTLQNITSGSNYKAFWICSASTCQHPHQWQTRVFSRTNKKSSGCPFCSGLVCCPCNSVAGKYPQLLAEWDSARNDRKSEQVSPNSAHLVWWKNSTRGAWQQPLTERVKNLKRRRRKEGLQRVAGQLDKGLSG